jgi:hypothetical protein
LENDAGANFGFKRWRALLEGLGSRSDERALALKREFSFSIKGLERVRDLAEYCKSLRIPIRDTQGPLVIIEVRKCKAQFVLLHHDQARAA